MIRSNSFNSWHNYLSNPWYPIIIFFVFSMKHILDDIAFDYPPCPWRHLNKTFKSNQPAAFWNSPPSVLPRPSLWIYFPSLRCIPSCIFWILLAALPVCNHQTFESGHHWKFLQLEYFVKAMVSTCAQTGRCELFGSQDFFPCSSSHGSLPLPSLVTAGKLGCDAGADDSHLGGCQGWK